MNKQETILSIQKALRNPKGYPEVNYLNKLTAQEWYVRTK